MTKPALRTVPANGTMSVEMSDAIAALALECAAAQPTAVLMIWEVPSKHSGTEIQFKSLPNSLALQRGFSSLLWNLLHPESDAVADD